MEQKEFNLQILAAMVAAAEKIASQITATIPGRYTASELAKGKNALNEDICLNWGGVDESEPVRIEVGAFKCEFAARDIFAVLQKFERLCNLRSDKKAHFAIEAAKRAENAQYAEIVNEPAVMVIGGKTKKRKTAIKILLTGLGIDGSDCYGVDGKNNGYYKHAGTWYEITNGDGAYNAGHLQRDKDCIYRTLCKFPYEKAAGNRFTQIYMMLYEKMQASRNIVAIAINEMPENERSAENKTMPVKKEPCTPKKEVNYLRHSFTRYFVPVFTQLHTQITTNKIVSNCTLVPLLPKCTTGTIPCRVIHAHPSACMYYPNATPREFGII